MSTYTKRNGCQLTKCLLWVLFGQVGGWLGLKLWWVGEWGCHSFSHKANKIWLPPAHACHTLAGQCNMAFWAQACHMLAELGSGALYAFAFLPAISELPAVPACCMTHYSSCSASCRQASNVYQSRALCRPVGPAIFPCRLPSFLCLLYLLRPRHLFY